MSIYISEYNYSAFKFREQEHHREIMRAQMQRFILRWFKKRFPLPSLMEFLKWCHRPSKKHQTFLRYVSYLESKYGKSRQHDIFSVFFLYFDWSVDDWHPDTLTDVRQKIVADPTILLEDAIFNTYKYDGIIDFVWPFLSPLVGHATFLSYATQHSSRMIKNFSQKTPEKFRESLEQWKKDYIVPFPLIFPLGCHVVDYYQTAGNAENTKELISTILYELSALNTAHSTNSIAVSQAFCEFQLAFEWDIPLVWTSWIRERRMDTANTYPMTSHNEGILLEVYFKNCPETLDIYYHGQAWRPSEMLHFLKTGEPPETVDVLSEAEVLF